MAHQLFKLTQKLYGVPHLVSQQSFSNITSYLSARNANTMLPMAPQEPEASPDNLDDISGVGIINVCGPLTYKASGWEAICGGCSYEGILEKMDDMIEEGAKCIILNMDSGGGEAYGVFLAAEDMRKKCDDAGVSLIGYVDGCCASACYALACVCDELIANPFAEVGSIGVLIALTDSSKHLEQDGYKPVFVSAGAEKIPYSDDGSFRPEFLADLQYKVDSLYDSFAAHVSKFTGLSIEDIKATEARTFMAKDALDKGLINKIMSNAEFVDYIVSKQMGGSTDA